MTIDFQSEYDNRARVPEHPAIFESWTRDAAAYRAQAGSRFTQTAYGPGDRRTIDLFAPEGERRGALVVFVHGGYWRSLDPSLFSHVARGLNARGLAVALPGYDLCPSVRITEIVEEIRAACAGLGREHGRLVVAGHSAGGHLAACMIAADWAEAGLPADLVPAAYAISGLFDLAPLMRTDINQSLRLDDAEARAMSPLLWTPPRGRILDAVVGGDESGEFLRNSREITEAWGRGGVETRYEAIQGANHFTVLDPLPDPDSAMTRRIAELALA
jgi:arylformamidase